MSPRTIIFCQLSFVAAACLWLSSVAFAAEQTPAKKLLVLVQGPDGHPAGAHEFVAGGEILRRTMQGVPQLEVQIRNVEIKEQTADGKLADQIAAADGVVLYLAQGAKWLASEERNHQALTRLAEHGGGLFALHWAIGTKEEECIQPFVQLFGACHGGADRKYKVLETTVTPSEHIVTQGIQPFKIHDEFYYQLKTNPEQQKLVTLLSVEIESQPYMVGWGWERPDGGRSAGFSGGHFHANWQREEYRRFIAQAILWTLKLEAPKEDFPPKLDEEVYILPQK